MFCSHNNITSLDVSNNTALTSFYCFNNQLTSLDLSQNTNLESLSCYNNQLSSLDVRNGNNTNFTYFNANANNNLTCIDVDDPVWSTTNWINIDPQQFFSNNCLFSLKTYIPDDNFENYLETNGMGDGIPLNDSVYTSAIDTLITLDVSNMNISDLTGIEDFTALWSLNCANNQLTNLDVSNSTGLNLLHCGFNQLISLDISNNTGLNMLHCSDNQLTSIDLSNNLSLQYLDCENNQLTNLDISNNPALIGLDCSNNQLTSLDVSNNPALAYGLDCSNNQLTSLDVRNGNNVNFNYFDATNNPNLNCISVDDPAWSTANWTDIDPWSSFSSDCSLISGCTDFRQATGREKITFDEFAVLEQKLLEIPQTFELNLTDKSTNIQTHSKKTFNNLLNIKTRSKMDGDDKFFACSTKDSCCVY